MATLEYQACPFCGWNRPSKYGYNKDTLQSREVTFGTIDPSQVRVWQLRELTGGIKGQPRGGHIKIIDSKVITQLSPEGKEEIKAQAQRILKLCE